MIRSLARVLLCVAAIGSPVAGQKGVWGIRAEGATVLRGVLQPADVVPAGQALARLGASALGELFGFLAAGQVAVTGADPVPIDLLRRAALECALTRFPRPEITSLLTELARRDSSDRERVTALELLGRIGTRSDLMLCLELGASVGDRLPGPALKAALRQAFAAIAEREDGVPRALCTVFARTSPPTRPAILDLLQERAGRDAVALLGGLLGVAGSEADELVLLALAGLDDVRRADPDALTLQRVRRYLSQDRRLASLACAAVEHLRDYEAVPDLIALLGHSDANVRQRAHRSLVALTGLVMGTELLLWMEWLDESMAWWEVRSEPCHAALEGTDAADAARAISEIAGQRLYLDQVVQFLVPGLHRPESDLVRLTCRALRSMHDPAVRGLLEPLVQHPDPAIAEEARVSLMRLRPVPTTPSRRLALTLRR